jgi:hypothetical protein
MADEQTPQQNQQIPLRIVENRKHVTYANVFRSISTEGEVVMDFGMNTPMQANNQVGMLIEFESRVVMNWVTAKQLAMDLAQLIRRYESVKGEIPVNRGGGQAQG